MGGSLRMMTGGTQMPEKLHASDAIISLITLFLFPHTSPTHIQRGERGYIGEMEGESEDCSWSYSFYMRTFVHETSKENLSSENFK